MAAASGDKLDISPAPRDAGVRFRVRVKPRASSSGVVGVRGGELELRVSAPPVEGAANSAVVAILAELLGVPKTRISIVSGEHARSKLVCVLGLTEEECLARIPG